MATALTWVAHSVWDIRMGTGCGLSSLHWNQISVIVFLSINKPLTVESIAGFLVCKKVNKVTLNLKFKSAT